ncbi:hypothetical protein Ga0080559_TMP229 (plasmid) [Salipiger profundus]|uniref:Uncharacterized protein n=1 Tax=Salipiger profundus TaxID=1229727 RepID=A0A1U7DDS9_9RHOB|nr:hypothetical protein Ga0080559_TMP229 [Salipiger profundus]
MALVGATNTTTSESEKTFPEETLWPKSKEANILMHTS